MYVGVVLNPLARKNRRGSSARFSRIERTLGGCGEVVRTDSLDALRPAVERLLPRATHLVSDGGDGALHWMINEVRAVSGGDASAASWPVFVPTNGGTIDFVAHKAGIRGRSEAIVRALVDAEMSSAPPPTVSLDTLHLTGELGDGGAFDRVGFALAAGGVGQRFFDKYYEDPEPTPATIVRVITRTVSDFARERLGRLPSMSSEEVATRSGRLSTPISGASLLENALHFLRGRASDLDADCSAIPVTTSASDIQGRESWAAHLFRPTAARVVIDGEELAERLHAGLHAGAFDVNLGGVVRVFPLAKEPGVLHFQAGAISPAGMIANLPALVRGGAIRGPHLRDTAGARMQIEALDEDLLDPVIDGERFRGLRALDITLGPRVRIARVRA